MKKKLLVLLMILAMGILSGCGMTEEEASEYVKASLDAAYKGEFDAFVEITDSTPEGAQAMYEENMIHTMEAAGFSDLNLSDELTEQYRQLFLDISKVVNYTVGAAKECEDDGYDVTVEIYPLLLFDNIDEEAITEAVVERIEGMKKYPSDEKIVEITFEEMYEMLAEDVKAPVYSEEMVTQTVGVHKDEEGMYYILEEDMLALDNALFNLHDK